MAKRNNSKKNTKKRLDTLLTYARAMNLHSIVAYQNWCQEHGFATSLNKSKIQLDREYRFYKLFAAKSKLKQYKRESNFQCIVNKLYSQRVAANELNSEILRLIGEGFARSQNRKLLRDVLLQIDETAKLLEHIDYVRGVINFVKHYGKWLRPLSEWQPKTHNSGRQFAALARHLFARYDVPAFMDTVWMRNDKHAMLWFVHIGMGNNIRSAPDLPVKMTKKMAHHFLLAPANYDAKSAFRWAQIHALGGTKVTANAIVGTRLAHSFRDDDFWLTVLRFLIANPMLDTRQYNPIVDYIWNQKYENQIVFLERGIMRQEGPAQPHFNMRGRTPASILRQVDHWHRQLGKATRSGQLQWAKSDYSDFLYTEGHKQSDNRRTWSIRELLSSAELIAEGRKQQHCVATYARSCRSGQTAIWTMDIQETLGLQKLLTIELHKPSKTIRQIRGLRNRLATSREMEVVHRWAAKEGFAIPRYVVN